MRRFALVVIFAFAFAPVSRAQAAKRPMTFEDMMQMKRLGATAVSPDGVWLGYTVTSVDLEQNTRTPELWIQRIAGGEPRKLDVGQPGDDGLEFAPDGKHILFLSTRELASQQVWVADFDAATGATANAHRFSGMWDGADNAKWSPDSKWIAFTAEVYPDCPPIVMDDFPPGNNCNMDRDVAFRDGKVKAQIFTHLLYRHWNHFTGDKRSHIFLAAVSNGFVRDLNPNDPHDVPPFSMSGGGGFAFAPDTNELAFTENLDEEPATSTNADIFTLDLTNPGAKPVKVSTSPGGDFDPAYSPDGKYLAWRSQARAGYESDKFRLMLYDRAAKTIKDLLPKFDNWVDEFAWGPSSRWIHFISENNGETDAYSVSVLPDSTVKLGYPEVAYQRTRSASFSGLRAIALNPFEIAALAGDEKLIATEINADRASEVVAIYTCTQLFRQKNLPAGVAYSCDWNPKIRQQPLTHLNDALLAQLDLAKMESFWFAAADGTKVEGFLIKPPGFDPAKKYPLKFLIHGGPQGAWGDAWSYRWNAELLAANGYVVVMINPRGSTGYGQAFVDGVNGDWGGKPYTDLMTGLDYAEQHYPFIDKTRECALGASYGGYMANWILGHTNRFKCIVSHDGMFDAESAFGSTEEDWFNIWEFRGHPWDYYGKPDADNPFRKWSPSLYATHFKTPTLVIHSQLDYRLDVSEGFQLFDTLQLLKVPSKMLYFPDEGHWVMKPQNSRLWYKTVNDWVDEWTGKTGTRD
jgi:dipeptidyl aminopeptidase/acylaminoacyl peptidase